MQPYEIKTRPGKATLTIVVIMFLLVVENCNGHGKCDRACFGPVWKVNFYNDGTGGYLNVHGRHVLANKSDNGYLYKISKGEHFYLYDPMANRFICWNRHHTNLVGRRYKKSESLKLCEFKDSVSDNIRKTKTHVQLHYAYNDTIKMKFNKRGRFSTKKALLNCKANYERRLVKKKIRHHHTPLHCEFPDFLVVNECECEEAFKIFCCSDKRHMREMSEICHLNHYRKCDNNETFYNVV